MSEQKTMTTGLRLRVLEGQSERSTVPLESSSIVLGRTVPNSPTSPHHVTFTEPTVSRIHAILEWDSEQRTYSLHHRSQTNPSLVNGASVSGQQLVDAGDRIELGRLVLLLERDPAASARPQIALTSHTSSSLQVMRLQNGSRYSMPAQAEKVRVEMGPEVGGTRGEGTLQLQYPRAMELEVQFSSNAKKWSLSARPQSSEVAYLLLQRSELLLRLPLEASTEHLFESEEAFCLGGYLFWLDEEDSPVKVSPESLEDRPRLVFESGPWSGAEILVPREGYYGLNLGHESWLFSRPLPATNVPQCSLSFVGGEARVRLHLLEEGHPALLDRRPVLEGESLKIAPESLLELGDLAWRWLDPESVHFWMGYRLEDGERVYQVKRSSITIGTAPHCEVVLESQELPPVLGRLNFGPSGVEYTHTDLTRSVMINGVEVTAGLRAPLKVGQALQFGDGYSLKLECETSPDA